MLIRSGHRCVSTIGVSIKRIGGRGAGLGWPHCGSPAGCPGRVGLPHHVSVPTVPASRTWRYQRAGLANLTDVPDETPPGDYLCESFTLYFKEHVMSCQSFANLLAAYKTRARPLHDQAGLPRYGLYSDGASLSEQERTRRKNSQFMSTVGCKTCDELVNACKRSARYHMNFVRASKKDAALAGAGAQKDHGCSAGAPASGLC